MGGQEVVVVEDDSLDRLVSNSQSLVISGNNNNNNHHQHTGADHHHHQHPRPKHQHRPKRHEKLRKFRTNFDIVEMPEHMQSDAIEFATESLDKYGQDYDEAADHMCRRIEQKYREIWSCLIGQNFGYSIEEPEPGKFMLFYIGNVNRIRVMAYVSKLSSSSSSQT
ncbi:uncharacterized protein LOC128953235 [Oppia nitens]|uniref:uncharacterized protein LOC128953235 n=1 Tax=Oppia nitens TaxID=1686743 RepID=UPI0023DCE651|nr:uncharacterized protein LOC128953235 [Oppia nitens]